MKNAGKLKYLSLCLITALLSLCVFITGFTYGSSDTALMADNEANIIILTHGENIGIGCWGNIDNGETLVYRKNSLLEQITANLFADIYVISYSDEKLNIRQLIAPTNENAPYTEIEFVGFNKNIHNILIFESKIPLISKLQDVYSEFKKAVYDALQLYDGETGITSKVNLLGYSRGGIVNMNYAVDYPSRVNKLISVGTPYNGSHLANYEIAKNYFELNSVIDSGANEPNTDLQKRWNDLADKPELIALGTYMSSSYLDALLTEKGYKDKLKWAGVKLDDLTTILKIPSKMVIGNLVLNYLNMDAEEFSDFATTLCEKNRLSDNGAFLLSSQLADGYSGAEKIEIGFDNSDYYDTLNCVQGRSFKLPHNIETNNQNVISAVIEQLSFDYAFIYKNGGYYLTRLKSDLLKDETVSIDEFIEEKKVIGLSDNLFSSLINLKTVNLSSAIKYIENDTFKDCNKLERINVDNANSALTDIDGVLYSQDKSILYKYPSNKSDASLIIDKNAKIIYDNAFQSASNLKTVDIGNVEFIGNNAFLNSVRLESVSGGANLKRTGIDSFAGTPLWNKTSNIILGKTLVKLGGGAIPEGIEYIGSNAVTNKTFGNLDLTGIRSVGNKAFDKCSFNNIVFGQKLETLGEYAFNDCSVSEYFLFKGATPPVISYSSLNLSGETSIYVPALYYDDYISSNDYAYYELDKMPISIVLDADNGEENTVIELSYYDFIPELIIPLKNGYIFKGWHLDNTLYEKGMLWDFTMTKTLVAHWETIDYNIKYDLGGGLLIEENPAFYNIESDDIVLNTPVKTGYDFIGWYENDSMVSVIEKGTTGNKILVAKYMAKNYSINLDSNADDIPDYILNVEFGSEFKAPVPIRENYKFLGWFDRQPNDDGSEIMIANESGEGFWNYDGLTVLYAGWKIENFELAIELQDDALVWVMSDGTLSNTKATIASGTIIQLSNLIYDFKRSEYGYVKGYKFIKFILPDADEITTGSTGISQSVDELCGSAQSVKISAEWEIETHTYVFNTQVLGKTFSDLTLEYGNNYNLPSADRFMINEIRGMHFEAWYTYHVENGIVVYDEMVPFSGIMPDMTLPSDLGNPDDRYNAQRNGSITLIAKWVYNEYYISFDSNGGNKIDPIKVTYGEKLNLPETNMTGAEFVQWLLNNESVHAHYDYIEDISLKADWNFTKFNITYTGYEEFDGIPVYDFTVQDEIILCKAFKLGYRFNGWKDENNNIITKISRGTAANKRLTADWTGVYNSVGSSSSKYMINNAFSIINVTGNREFEIAESVEQVMFQSNGTKYTVNLTVAPRSKALTIIFKNVNLTSKNNTTLLNAINANQLNIISYGSNTLKGGNITLDKQPAAIIAKNIEFYGTGNLEIIGGSATTNKGIDGIDGANAISISGNVINNMKNLTVFGGNGSNGAKPAARSDNTFVPDKQTKSGQPGFTGETGFTGLDGGSGGKGGIAIVANGVIRNNARVIDCYLRQTNEKTYFEIVGGNGGEGGQGGKGGKGGVGGEGKDGTLFVYGTVGGNGGKGGKGGDGGIGGVGGKATADGKSAENCTLRNGNNGLAGLKGEGGDGGSGGLGGWRLDKKWRWGSGSSGSQGDSGSGR